MERLEDRSVRLDMGLVVPATQELLRQLAWL